jgi:glutamate carboxypeptidase
MTSSLLQDLERLVRCESPSSDLRALHLCADELADLGTHRLGISTSRREVGGKPLLWFGPRDAEVLLLGHLDTVHPLGTLARVPFRVVDGRASGPGVFDMKAGLVQGLHALARHRHQPVALLVTADEELGSPDSRLVIEAAARKAHVVLVLEASSEGRLKTARKGVASYRLEISGRAAHAGLEPERGANACVALAKAVFAIIQFGDFAVGTTVTPTVAAAGTTVNTVPERATLAIDVRAVTVAEQERVDAAVRTLKIPMSGVRTRLIGGINRPPMPESSSSRLFALAQRAATEVALPPLESVHAGGGSDGNFTAALGIETLDGLGAVGDGAHTESEWVDVTALEERKELLTRLIDLIIDERDSCATGSR